MISLEKQYKTRQGHAVILLAIISEKHADSNHRVIGLFNHISNKWRESTWTIDGKFDVSSDEQQPLDLVEVSDDQYDLPFGVVINVRGIK